MGRLGLAIVCGGLLAGAAVQGAQAAAAGPAVGITSVGSSQGTDVYLLGQDVFHDPLSGKHAGDGGGAGYDTTVNIGRSAISFQANNAASGSSVTAVSSTAVTLNIHNGSHAISDVVNGTGGALFHSSITPAGLGFYVAATQGGECLYVNCSLGGAPFASLGSIGDEIGRVGVKFSVLQGAGELATQRYSVAGEMILRLADNALGYTVDDTDLKNQLGFLTDFTLATNPASNKAYGYAWSDTDIDVRYGGVGAFDDFSLTYLTEVTSTSSANCINPGVACLIAYAGFGDPIGRGGGIESLDILGGDLFSLSAFSPDVLGGGGLNATSIGGLNFGVAQFQVPTFDEATGDINFRSITDGVPEPATWAVMILGFGVVGTTLRRRRVAGANA